jgi:DNA-binding CsgD family transcriptional regulator
MTVQPIRATVVVDTERRCELVRHGHSELGAAVVDCIGLDNFADAALHRIDAAVHVGAWTVFRIHDDAAPVMELAATRGRQDVTSACWQLYRDGLYKTDHSFDAARDVGRENRVALTRLCLEQLSDAHRAKIYDFHQLQERLSFVVSHSPGTLLAVNFYRFLGQPTFASEDERVLASVAPVLIAAIRRHIILRAEVAPHAPTEGLRSQEIAILRERCPRLTARELEVCAALVQGWTFEGIAAHLNVSAATVKTYRDRAFRRLGIYHRNQLYGMCMDGVTQLAHATSADSQSGTTSASSPRASDLASSRND